MRRPLGMVLEYTCDHARNRIQMIAHRPPTLPDLVAVFERQALDGAWGYGALIDLRSGMLPLDDKPAVLRHVDGLSLKNGVRGPVALVVTNLQPLRPYVTQAGRAGYEIELFRYSFQANEWLNELAPR